MPHFKNAKGEDLEEVWESVLKEIDPAVRITEYGAGGRNYYVQHAGETHLVHGFNTGVNLVVSQMICQDKKLAHSILTHYGLPVVEHKLFVGSQLWKFSRRSSLWQQAEEFFKAHGECIVMKPTRGKSGDHVFKVTTREKLSQVLLHLDSKFGSYVGMPFVDVASEVRVMIAPVVETDASGAAVVTPKVSFMIEKTPLTVVGDGKTPLQALIRGAVDPNADVNGILQDILTSGEEVDLDRVLAVGEKFAHWKHNESKGSVFQRTDASSEVYKKCEKIALAGAAAASLYAGCVDILKTTDGQYKVLELNTAIMLDYLELPVAEVVPIVRRCLDAKTVLLSNLRAATAAVRDSMTAATDSQNEKVRPQDFHQKSSLKLRTITSIAGGLHEAAEVASYDYDYLVMVSLGGAKRCFNVNYDFGIVLSAGGNITGRKVLTYEVLRDNGVACVPHWLPNRRPPSGSLQENFFDFHENAKHVKYPCVLKPDSSSSGRDVSIVTSLVDMECSMLKGPHTTWCLSPFEVFTTEFRVIIFGGKVAVAYSKSRPTVEGDGVRTVAQLMTDLCASQQQASRRDFLSSWMQGYPSVVACGLSPYKLHDVPKKGDACLISWQHNLSLGAEPDLAEALPDGARDVAERAADVLSLPYAAVDVAGVGGEWQVLEVNASPAWDHLLSTQNAVAKHWLNAVIRAATCYNVFAAPPAPFAQ
eukprot:TRINITY_DN22861_c0_g1_i1.p1 TRINITY_DN22861_c0_g1~~TRINITY_DN22861_c0_g1_i1.p1  ORF type:complete len:702 (+),score=281.45 TRINITY_DN22861_c0_g1_i1:69-2174(+)